MLIISTPVSCKSFVSAHPLGVPSMGMRRRAVEVSQIRLDFQSRDWHDTKAATPTTMNTNIGEGAVEEEQDTQSACSRIIIIVSWWQGPWVMYHILIFRTLPPFCNTTATIHATVASVCAVAVTLAAQRQSSQVIQEWSDDVERITHGRVIIG